MALDAGATLLHYRIVEKLGEGGMGVVYRAHDTKLKRDVALKILPFRREASSDSVARFKREAEAVAALNHPNIVMLHSIEEAQHPVSGEDVHFLTMELVDGSTLAGSVPEGGLPLDEFFAIARPLTDALATAHSRGIVHRDLKPGNIMFSERGPKILDFGLAKLLPGLEAETQATTEWQTAAPAFLGTPGYASPEQVEGKPADPRSDIFSIGCVFYYLLTGRNAFDAPTAPARIAALMRGETESVRAVRPEVPQSLAAIVERCLSRESDRRYASGKELRDDLEASRPAPVQARRRSLWLVAAVAIPVLAILGIGLWWGMRTARVSRVHRELVPQIESLVSERRNTEAFVAARKALEILPGDPRVIALLETSTRPVNIITDPPGAEIAIKDYSAPGSDWIVLGNTPIEGRRVPGGELRWRATKDGHTTREGGFTSWFGLLEVKLHPESETPPGMVFVPEGQYDQRATPVHVPAFWIDRREVSNRKFRNFVEGGGYRDEDAWLDLTKADLARLTDTTGRPGPAHWSLGSFPDGEADLPVTGISWFEASAYCRSEGKRLPTLYHWRQAASVSAYSAILTLSNFGGKGVAPVGSHEGIGPYGTYDMAGNVREWVANLRGDRRYVLGGAWNQPEYLFLAEEVVPPLDRSAGVGVRCMLPIADFAEELAGPVKEIRYDFRQDRPVSEELYRVFASQYTYDRVAVTGTLAERDESPEHWIRETVRYPAAYGDDEIIAHIYLPRNSTPPYQTVLYFPGSGALDLTSSRNLAEMTFFHFVPKSGRAFVYPVYQATYERGGGKPVGGPSAVRDLIVQWGKDVSRTVDYLETREDIDSDRIAMVGLSLGAMYGPVFGAIEERLKAMVLIGGGLSVYMLDDPPEIYPLNFAPYCKTPTMMITGRYDSLRPVDTAQRPLFDQLGTPDEHKIFVELDGGHVPEWNDMIRETLDWLDRYLDPVR